MRPCKNTIVPKVGSNKGLFSECILTAGKPILSCRKKKSSARHVGVHPYKHQYTRVPPKKTATSKLPVEHSSIPWVVSTHLKTMLVKLDHFLKERGENINV